MNLVRAALLSGLLLAGGARADVRTPLLKWQYGGCTSFCQTGWYSSPAIVDVDGNGSAEVVAGSYDLVLLNGATGATLHRAVSATRIWPGIAVADLNHDGHPSVAIGHNDGTAAVFDAATLAPRSGWPVTPFPGGEVRALALGDLDANGSYQIVVGAARSGGTNQVDVYAPGGSQRVGWPRLQVGDAGSAAGIYNDDIAIGDLAGSGVPQIYVPTDVHYILGLHRDGSAIPANAIFGAKVWAEVGVHVNQSDDIRGYADCSPTGHGLRPNFAASAPAIGDVNGDGILELAVVGNVYDCTIGNDALGDRYHLPWLLNADRSRFNASGYDWTTIPAPSAGSAPLSEDYTLIENAQPEAVLADLDGNGRKEILYSSYDGKVHAYWLDKTEHGNWPFAVPGVGLHFASPPVVADLYHDGQAEVIFATWPQVASIETGKLYILDHLGSVLQAVDLPAPNGDTWNGGMASPTLGILPGSRNLAVVLMTHASGAVAYELPQTAYARTLWPTGRGSYLRNGVAFNERIFADGFGG